MEMFKRKHQKNNSWVVYLFILFNSPILIAQFSMEKREGVISAVNGLEKISVTYKNDTVCGNFFYYKNSILIKTGFLDNHKAKYLTEIEYNMPKYQQGESEFGVRVEYFKHKQFKDTFEMLLYDIKNSLLVGSYYQYYPNGKINGKVNYELGIDEQGKNTTYRVKDSSIWYYESGQIQDITVKRDNYKIETYYYNNGLLKSKACKMLKDSKQIYLIYDNYYPNGKLKNTATFSFVSNKKDGIEQEYNEKGTLISVSYYKEGLRSKLLGLDKSGKLKEIK